MLQEDKNILWRLSAVLLGLALPGLVLGKAVMMILLGFGALFGLLATKDESLRATMNLIVGSWMTLLMLAFLSVALVGVVTGINPAFAFDKWQQLMLAALAGVLLFMTFREMPGRHLETTLAALTGGTLGASALVLIDAVVADPNLSLVLHGDKASLPTRLNFMSGVLAVLLPFVAAHILTKLREGEPLAVRTAPWALALGVLAVIVCGGEAGWSGFVAAAVLFLLLAGRYHGLVLHKRHWGLLVSVLLAGAALYVFVAGWHGLVGKVAGVAHGGGFFAQKLAIWKAALAHMTDKPFFGIGIMNYRNLGPGFDLHPHNWLLQLLLETGIFGTFTFCLGLVIVLRRFFAYGKGNLYGVAGLASVVAFLVTGLSNTSIFYIWWVMFLIFAAVLGWRAGWGGDDLKRRRRSRIVLKPLGTTGE